MNPGYLPLPGLPLPLDSAWVPTPGTAPWKAGSGDKHKAPFICFLSHKDHCLLLHDVQSWVLFFI